MDIDGIKTQWPPFDSVALIISPYHVGICNHRVGDGPNRILQWNLIGAIEGFGVGAHIVGIGPVDKCEGDIGRSFEVLRQTSKLVTAAREQNSFPIILAGNCMTSVGVACGLGLQDLKFIVFDAHDDMNTPSTTKSGYLDGMGHEIMQADIHRRFLFCGLRDVSDEEKETLQASGATVVWGGVKDHDRGYTMELESHLDRNNWSPALIHVDLDVLDESLGKVNDFSCPGGLQKEDLGCCSVSAIFRTKPQALIVASFDPYLGGGHAIARIAVATITQFVASMIEAQALRGHGFEE